MGRRRRPWWRVGVIGDRRRDRLGRGAVAAFGPSGGAWRVACGVGVGVGGSWSFSPVHSRKLPHDPQKLAPASFSNPQVLHVITAFDPPVPTVRESPQTSGVYPSSRLAAVAVIATLDPAAPRRRPRQARPSLTVRVRNQGTIVDRFALTVVGPLAQWARAEPSALSLFPGQDGEAQITFSPPREPLPRAGTFPFGIRVKAEADPTGVAVEEGTRHARPVHRRGGRDRARDVPRQPDRAATTSSSTTAATRRWRSSIGAVDPDRLVDFTVQPGSARHRPGRARRRLDQGFRPRHVLPRLEGPSPVQRRGQARAAAAPIQLRASMVQGPVLPSWLPIAGGLAVAGLVAVFALSRITGSPPSSAAGTTTAQRAAAHPPRSSRASDRASPADRTRREADASPSDGGGGGGSPTPEPSPTPGPFQLTIVGDSIQTGGALQVKCEPEPADSECLQDALTTSGPSRRRSAGRTAAAASSTPTTSTSPRRCP